MGSNPGLIEGLVPTAAQWNSYFSAKLDDPGYTPFSVGGGIFTGPVTTAPSASGSTGFNIAVGTAPSSPNNGDIWTTASGLFTHIAGSTINLSSGIVTGFAGGTLTGKLFTAASTVSLSGLNITPGVAPASPVNGDVWVTSSGLFAQIGGSTLNVSQPSQLNSLTLKASPISTDVVLGYDTVGAQLVKMQVGTLGPSDVLKSDVTANITKGYTVTPVNQGTVLSGTFTPDPTQSNYQYYTNGGAHTVATPASDCAIDILVTNGSGAGAISFSGYTVGSNTGDPLTTTNTSKFIISIRRINGVSTYLTKALQ